MKSIDRFLLATSDERSKMIASGYESIGYRFKVLAAELKTINQFLRQVPDSITMGNADVPVDRWADSLTLYANAGDDLSDAMIENAQCLEQIEKALNHYNKTNGITTTTSTTEES